MAGEQLAWCAAPFGRLHVFMNGPAFDVASAANEHGYVRKGLRFGGVAGRNMPWAGASRPDRSAARGLSEPRPRGSSLTFGFAGPHYQGTSQSSKTSLCKTLDYPPSGSDTLGEALPGL